MHDLEQSYLLVRAGAFRCALPLRVVKAVMRPLPLRSASSLSAAVLGVTTFRGAFAPVVSLPILLGQPAGCESRFVALVTGGGRDCVLAVDAVEQIGKLQDASFQPLPPLLQGMSAAQAVVAADPDFALTLNLGLVENLLPNVGEVP